MVRSPTIQFRIISYRMQSLQNGRSSNLSHNLGEYTFVPRCLSRKSSAFAALLRVHNRPPLPQILPLAFCQSRLDSKVSLRRRHARRSRRGSLVSSLFFSSISYATSETASHCTVVAYLVVWIHVTCNMGMHTYSPGTFRKKERKKERKKDTLSYYK